MDIIADALTRIRNASLREKKEVVLRKNKVIVALVDILKKEGFVDDYSHDESHVTVQLSYTNGKPVITHISRVSRGGQRQYVKASDLGLVMRGRGIGVISTSHGVMTTEDARNKGVGGEYICKIW